jgi:hypothetical protein
MNNTFIDIYKLIFETLHQIAVHTPQSLVQNGKSSTSHPYHSHYLLDKQRAYKEKKNIIYVA